MKFDEFKLTCEVVEPKEFNEEIDTPIPASTGYRFDQGGPIECKGKCGFKPFRPDWLSEAGYCNICENKRRRKEDLEAAFSSVMSKHGMCMRCGQEYYNLPEHGYCNQCMIIVNEMGLAAACGVPLDSEKATTRTLDRIPQSSLPKRPNGVGFYCYKCDKYKSVAMGEPCLDCQANNGGLIHFRCGSCYQMRATVRGSVCQECHRKLSEAGLGRPKTTRDHITIYTPKENGKWEEERISLPLGECQRRSTPLNPGDARMGAVEEV